MTLTERLEEAVKKGYRPVYATEENSYLFIEENKAKSLKDNDDFFIHEDKFKVLGFKENSYVIAEKQT